MFQSPNGSIGLSAPNHNHSNNPRASRVSIPKREHRPFSRSPLAIRLMVPVVSIPKREHRPFSLLEKLPASERAILFQSPNGSIGLSADRALRSRSAQLQFQSPNG